MIIRRLSVAALLATPLLIGTAIAAEKPAASKLDTNKTTTDKAAAAKPAATTPAAADAAKATKPTAATHAQHAVNPPLLPQYRKIAPAHRTAAAHAHGGMEHHRVHGWRHSLRYGYRPVRHRVAEFEHARAFEPRHVVHARGHWTHHYASDIRRRREPINEGFAPASYAYGYGFGSRYAVPDYYPGFPPAYQPGFLAVLGGIASSAFAPLGADDDAYGEAPCGCR